MKFEPKTFPAILRRMAARTVARSALRDLEVGGTVHTVLSAVARELDDVNFQVTRLKRLFDLDTAVGDDLDERARDVNPDELVRLGAVEASGTYTFTRTGVVGAVVVPAGWRVRVPGGGPEYATTADATIADGFSVSNVVGIVAVEGTGADGNADSGTVTEIDPFSGVTGGTNPSACGGGRDEESDADFVTRIRGYLRSLPRGTVLAIRAAALTAELDGYGRVASAEVVEGAGEVTLYVDDGAGTVEHCADNYGDPETVLAAAGGGEVRLYLANKPVVPGTTATVYLNAVAITEGVDYTLSRPTAQVTLDPTLYPSGLTPGDAVTAEYQWWVGLLAEVQKIEDGDPTDPTYYPGYRAAGIRCTVLPPVVLQQVVECSVVPSAGYDLAAIRTAVRAAINRYVNSLGINGDVVHSELVRLAKSVAGVYDVTFTRPTSNVTIGDGELARVADANIEVL